MADGIEFKDVPAEDLDRVRDVLAATGAKQIQVFQQPDGKYTISFLPGDPDFPTEVEGGHSAR